MEVSIIKSGRRYVGEFTVTEDFNLHVEKKCSGYMSLSQRTTDEGDYASLQGAGQAFYNQVIDMDIQAAIYPKYLLIESEVPIVKCIVTYNS